MTDEYGDPGNDPEADAADAVLRNLLSDIPAGAVDDPARASMIEVAIATAWPDGVPPTADELAHEPDFDAMMAITDATDATVGGDSTDDDVSSAAEDFVSLDGSDFDGDGVDEVADGLADDADWNPPEGTDE